MEAKRTRSFVISCSKQDQSTRKTLEKENKKKKET